MTRRSRCAPLWLILTALALTAQAPAGWVTVKATQQAPILSGFASVQPATDITIRALQPGVLTSLSVLPGESVRAGETIGRLGGPQIVAALATAQGASQAANAALVAERGKFADHLSTRAAVTQAEAAATAAQANLAALRAAFRLQSPVAGHVQSLAVGTGASLQAGQAVAVVQPAAGAWVRAVLYGSQAAALPPGLAARFIPANGHPAMPVTLRGMADHQADGGEVLAFAGTGLQPGEAGIVRLSLAPRRVLLVPSAALVLDDGRWWVMLRDANGDHGVQVVPGATEGTETPILSGLEAGDQVIVQDAALLYHRGIAAQYQPPD
ncbi:efflux RND transporter periplasmic adaptor subunit [Acidocella aminolytica]|uniref:efflux RND transporter periplasmic adaptor subunit n=1 Tax=Acidocella aminolytica TaxID=33998 RepID=UPI000662331F|nr:HlyD family efflux transporter periplasmic adaptor subunit [Acidocella aminolytica]SHF31518.1 Multidrug efflux pump subunit AcrA (membrane-fusion protein) [Acidocella aminolytica 101 = DSM 11237]